VNITSVIEQKRAVAGCYPSQFEENVATTILRHARAAGHQVGCEYAEGFATMIPLVGTRWQRPAEVGRLLLSL